MIETIQLAALHLILQATLFGCCFLAGGTILPRGVADMRSWLFTSGIRLVLGITVLLFVVSLAGLFGFLQPAVVFLIMSGFALVGALRSPISLPRWPDNHRWEWWAPPLLVPPAVILSGSLVPDMTHDSMWYHLSVPQQWAFAGAIEPMPSVMPSCYPLAVEALYAFLLPIGGEIACSMFYGCATIVMLALVAIVAREVAPKGAGAAAVLWVPLLAGTTPAPIQAGNDNVAALLLLGAVCVALAALRFPRQNPHRSSGDVGAAGEPDWKRLVAGLMTAGFLCGVATASKPVVIGFWPVVLTLAVLATGVGWKTLALALSALCAGWLIGYLPWLIIGLRSTGLPLFPLGSSIFALNPEFQATLEASKGLNSTYPVSMAGVHEALTKGLRLKIAMALSLGSVLSLLTPLMGLLAVCVAKGRHRLIGFMVLAGFGPAVMLQGHNELLRYYGVLFPLGIFGAAMVMGWLRDRVVRWHLLVAVLLVSSLLSWARAQHQWASFRTIQWDYLPVLTESRRADYAARTETGGLYLGFGAMRHLIPEEDRVLLLNARYPFYLRRRTLWNDEAVDGGIRSRWGAMNSYEAARFLGAERIQWVLVTTGGFLHDETRMQPLADMIDRGVLTEVKLPASVADMRLYKVGP